MFTKRTAKQAIIIGTPAKVNLDLLVLGRRSDGFHDIDSIFQAVSLFDRLKFQARKSELDITLRLTSKADLPVDETNLVVRAFRLLKERFEFSGSLEVELEKNIPIAAGLGGGSADGAATILACRELFDLPLNRAQMAELSLELGSDLPFFFSSGQAHVTGRGEIIRDLELPLDYWLVLVTPNIAVSTAEAYSGLKMPLTKSTPARTFRGWKAPADIVKWLVDTGNDFERVCLAAFPVLTGIKNDLVGSGALISRLSGSGPTVFGIYSSAPNLEGDRALGESDWAVSVVRPIRLPSRL